MNIELIEAGLVYRGSDHHPHLRNAAFPSIAQIDDGTLVVSLTICHGRNSVDVRCYSMRSTDQGRTWSEPERIFEPDESNCRVSTEIRMSRAHDGSLVGFVNLLRRTDPEAPTTNRETGGTVEREHAVIRSNDGRTWSELEPIRMPFDWKCFGEPSPILALSADRWLLPSLTRLNWDGECPVGLKSFVMISEDQGKSWPRTADVFNLWPEGIITWEQKQTLLGDGRILAVTWAFHNERRENLPNHYTFSSDGGESYGPPRHSPLHGQTCTPLALTGNLILCAYRRLDRNGLWAHVAEIDGDAWNPVTELCLWGSDREAIAGGRDSSIQQQHNLQFGFPQLVRLQDGTILVVFWAVEDGLSVIRRVRLRVG